MRFGPLLGTQFSDRPNKKPSLNSFDGVYRNNGKYLTISCNDQMRVKTLWVLYVVYVLWNCLFIDVDIMC